MNFRHLKIFITVCEEKNMTKAARSFLSVNHRLVRLLEMEEYYQVKLFERLSRKIYLTKAGRSCYLTPTI